MEHHLQPTHQYLPQPQMPEEKPVSPLVTLVCTGIAITWVLIFLIGIGISHGGWAAWWSIVILGIVTALLLGFGLVNTHWKAHQRHVEELKDQRHHRAMTELAILRDHSAEHVSATSSFRAISKYMGPAGSLTIKDVNMGNEQEQEQQALPVAPPFVEDFYDAIPFNSLQTGLGAKLTNGELVTVSIEESVHYKLIGGSGFGKSCLAAGMLDIATTTNNPDMLRVALLDLSWKTGRLFEHLPHVYEVRDGGRTIRMVGRDADEVAARLRTLKKELERRAAGLVKTPILLVFIEEMLSLQYEVDPRLLQQMLADLNVLVLRGRQYGIFFLSVMQTDYATKELREAKAQFRTRAGFAIDTTTARSAGFVNTELVKQNFMRGKPGQYLLERPAFSELMLAPRYNVEHKLLLGGGTTSTATSMPSSFPEMDVTSDVVTSTPVEPLDVISGHLSLRERKVLDLLKEKVQVTDIIKEVWNVDSKAGRPFRSAQEEYREIVAKIVKDIL